MKLTDEQIHAIANDGMRNALGGIYESRVLEFARAIEAEALAAQADHSGYEGACVVQEKCDWPACRRECIVDSRAQAAPCPQDGEAGVPSSTANQPPFANCRFKICDLPGQCRGEGHCHHPKTGERGAAPQDGDEQARKLIIDSPGILERIKGAKERLRDGHALMRIPVDPTDPDCVLADAELEIERLRAALASNKAAAHFSDHTVQAWAERHDIKLSGNDLRAAFDDAASAHLIGDA